MEILWLTIALVFMGIGLLGTVLPLLPGIPIIYVGYLVYGLATGWRNYGVVAVVSWGIVTLLVQILDYYAGALGAKKFGASSMGVWGSVIGAIVGFIIFNVAGLVIGTFGGALAGELIHGRSLQEALRSGWGAFIGFLVGSLFKVVLGVVMIGVFLWLVL